LVLVVDTIEAYLAAIFILVIKQELGFVNVIIIIITDSSRMGGSVRDVKSKAELDEAVNGGSPVVLHFWASWCEASKHMDQLFSHLATDFPHTHFLRVSFLSQLPFYFPFHYLLNLLYLSIKIIYIFFVG
jgi:thiol-disulfide isomerase/thioredoxin